MTNYNCPMKEKLEVKVEDIKCFQCKKKFLTQNLFEWHGCFLKTKGSCTKCGLYFQKKKLLFKHYVMCAGVFHSPEIEMIRKGVKSEFGVNAVAVPEKTGKGPKKKTVPNRKMSTRPDIVKKEIDLNEEKPEDEDEYANYEEDITYDNFGNDSDSNEEPPGGLEPEVQLDENQTVKIKQERLSDPPTIQQKSNQIAPAMIRNIKLEKGAAPATVVTTNNWKLKIKAEKGTNQASTQVLNPMALGSNKPAPAQKKVFKIPQGLAMKIKLEKKDAGYGDVMEARDEAEAEDEDLHGEASEESVVKIKQEKFDPGYGDSQSATAPAKQLLNPMALMREKSSSNGLSEKSLVISAVTSINSDSPGEAGVGEEAMTQNDTTTNAHETSETNDVPEELASAEKPRENLMMVQIPRELAENLANHSSTSVECVESSQAGGASETNCHEVEATVVPPSADDLDSLLKKYEDAPSADNNDLFNDLLKFD